MFGWYLICRNMSTDSVYFRKSIRAFKKHRCFVWIYSQLQIHTMLYVGGGTCIWSSTPRGLRESNPRFPYKYSTLAWTGVGRPGPRDPNLCLEVKKVPMFRDFAQKMDPCLGIFWKIFWARVASSENFCDFDEKLDPCLGIWGSKMGPMFRDFLSKTDPLGRHIPV